MIEIWKEATRYLNKAKSFEVSKNYILLYTGRRVIILDRDFNLISEIDNLEYVYSGTISPDETNLLLVSSRNKFYIVSLIDFSVKKQIIKGKNINSKGVGCWNIDGQSVYIPVLNKKSWRSTLRKYHIDNLSTFEELLPEQYYIVFVSLITHLKKYLIICHDKDINGVNLSTRLLWYDGSGFDNYVMEGFDDAILNVEVNVKNEILLFGAEKYAKYDFYGKEIKAAEHFDLETYKFNFAEVFSSMNIDAEKKKSINAIVTKLNMDDILVKETINTMCLSSDQKYLFIGTSLSLIIMDMREKKIIEKHKFEYGVKKITELSPGLLLVSNIAGVKILRFS